MVAQVTAEGQTDGTIAVTEVIQPGDALHIKVVDVDLNGESGALARTETRVQALLDAIR